MALITREYFDMLPLGLKDSMKPYLESIDAFIESASEQVEAYCERKFEVQQHVEQINGSGNNLLMLDQYPVISVDAIEYEDAYYGGPVSVSTNSVRLRSSGMLEWKYPITNGPWRQDRLYTVTYTAGYDPIPGPIKHATALWVTELMRPNFAGPRQETPAQLVPFSTSMIVDLLDNFRRRRIG